MGTSDDRECPGNRNPIFAGLRELHTSKNVCLKLNSTLRVDLQLGRKNGCRYRIGGSFHQAASYKLTDVDRIEADPFGPCRGKHSICHNRLRLPHIVSRKPVIATLAPPRRSRAKHPGLHHLRYAGLLHSQGCSKLRRSETTLLDANGFQALYATFLGSQVADDRHHALQFAFAVQSAGRKHPEKWTLDSVVCTAGYGSEGFGIAED
ncbi:hypothetical protein D3C86_1476710 [compost metagenome]